MVFFNSKMKRKAGNRYTANGICDTDKMYKFITKWPCEFSSKLIANKCGVSKNRASDFLRCMYKKSIIDKTERIGKFGLIHYEIKQCHHYSNQ